MADCYGLDNIRTFDCAKFSFFCLAIKESVRPILGFMGHVGPSFNAKQSKIPHASRKVKVGRAFTRTPRSLRELSLIRSHIGIRR